MSFTHVHKHIRESYNQAQLAAERSLLRLPRWAGEYKPRGPGMMRLVEACVRVIFMSGLNCVSAEPSGDARRGSRRLY